jgi:small subunit ribosomal protein S7
MSRKGPAKVRVSQPEAVYNSVTIAKIINAAMYEGKKLPSEKQIYSAIDLIKKEFPGEDVAIKLEQALDNIKPKVEVRPRRIGGAVYQVPTPVRGNRQQSLAIRWLISSARKKPNKQFHTFSAKLADEIKMALSNEGSAVAKRQEVERMAEANKAFAHLRW